VGLWLDDGKPQFAYALSKQPDHKFRAASKEALAPGKHVVRVAIKYAGGGVGKGGTAMLLVDEKEVAKCEIPQTVPARFSPDETFDVGEDTGTPIVEDYEAKMPYRFTGALKRFVVVLDPKKLSPEERKAMLEALSKVLLGGH
jgi:hypothetical protein